jgi:tropomyosin
MDKIKEKLEKLRIEADGNMARAENAETEVKDFKAQVAKQETTIQTLNNKITLLQGDVDRATQRADDVRLKKTQSDKDESMQDSMKRKVEMVEMQLDQKEAERKIATEKYKIITIGSDHSNSMLRNRRDMENHSLLKMLTWKLN